MSLSIETLTLAKKYTDKYSPTIEEFKQISEELTIKNNNAQQTLNKAIETVNDVTSTTGQLEQLVADVNNAGQTQTQRVNTAGDTQVSRVQTEGATQVQNVQATAAEIAADREQIHTNRDNVAQLQRNSAGAITRSAEGSFITVSDAADGMGFRQLEIQGMTEQRNTTGAQLLNLPDIESAVSNGLTYSIKNGVVTASGTPTVEYASIVAEKINLPPGNYYASGRDTTSGRLFLQMAITSADGNKTFYSNKGFTVDGTEQSIDYVVQIGSNITALSKCTLYPMLNAGSAALPWEPYTGAAPSPSPEYPQELENVGVLNKAGKYEVAVTSSGAQLLPYPYKTSNGTVDGITAKATNSHIKLNGITTAGYNFVFAVVTRPDEYAIKIRGKHIGVDLLIYDRTSALVISSISKSDPANEKMCNFTVEEGHIVQIYFNTSNTNVSLDVDVDIMMTTAEDIKDAQYTPYSPRTATITSDRPLTKWDKLTCRDGVWGWRYKGFTVVEDGTRKINNDYYPILVLDKLEKKVLDGAKVFCNYCTSDYIGCANVAGGNMQIAHADTLFGVANAEEMEAWLTQKNAEGKPLYYQYEMKVEEWVPLSPAEQATMNALCTYSGTTHIWTDDPLQPVISLDYTVDTDGYIRDTVPAYRDVERFALTGEASGAMATCTDSAEWPLLGIGMRGKCEQVTTTGAQLFDQTAVTAQSYVNDVTGVIGSIAEDVNASDYISVVGYEHIKITSTMKSKQWGAFYDANKTFLSGIVGYDKLIPVPANASYTRLTVVGDNLDTFMVNAGETALPWEPYTGGAPSPSPAYPQEVQETGTYNPETGMYEADMVIKGAQLIDFEQCLKNWNSQYTQVDGRVYTVTALGTSFRQPISFSKNDIKVTLSGNVRDIAGSGYRVDLMDLAGNVVGRINKDIKSVTGMASKIRLNFAEAGSGEYTDIMLNIGDTDIPWEPYQSDTLHLTADQPWRSIGDVHDEVCERDGVLGTWRRYETTVYNTAAPSEDNILAQTKGIRIKAPKDALYNGEILCDKFTREEAWGNDKPYIFNYGGGAAREIAFRVAVGENKDTFFVDNPIKLIYQLAEPYFLPFPEDIQKQYRKLKSYAGTTHAWVDDPLRPEVFVKYAKNSNLVLKKLEDRLTALETVQAQTTAAFGYLPANIQAEMIENETNQLMDSI